MTTQSLTRISGAALILVGVAWTAGNAGVIALSYTDPLSTDAAILAYVGAPALLILAFLGILIEAIVSSSSGRLAGLTYGVVALVSLGLAATTLNLLHDNSDPAWYAFVWSIVGFIAGLGISTLALAAAGLVPRWAMLPVVVIAAAGVAGWIAGQAVLNLITLPNSFATVVVLAFGGALMLLGAALCVRPSTRFTSPVLRRSAAT